MRIEYAVQPSPDGLAQAYLIGGIRERAAELPGAGRQHLPRPGLTAMLKRAGQRHEGATVFGYWVRDPERYGVAEFDGDGKVIGIEEKPPSRAPATRLPACTSTTVVPASSLPG
jgi:glucose-1-phosphate thymidylyltransferase